MKKLKLAIPVIMVIFAAIMMIPVGGGEIPSGPKVNKPVERMSMSTFSSSRPSKSLSFLFIHHSCGGQLFANQGSDDGSNCIYVTHPNGGGLRQKLQSEGYEVHEASNNSEVGDKTDIFDWLPKFRDKMDKVLTCDNQNTYYSDSKRNNIVAFKPCFPNNNFSRKGDAPGNPEGPELTVWNARASYTALLKEFQKYPETLYVAVTAPPLVGHLPSEPLWKAIARLVLNKPREKPSKSGELAREFNNWMVAKDGWLKDYTGSNVVVFDYYDILTASGRSNYAEYPSSGGSDSHPNSEGNTAAAKAFVPLLNQAVRRAGLSD